MVDYVDDPNFDWSAHLRGLTGDIPESRRPSWERVAPPPKPEAPFSEVPKLGKPIGPDVPEPKWGETPKPQSSSHPLSGLIGDAAKKHGIDPRTFGAIMMIESGGNPNLVNKHGYSGLFQFQPGDFAKRGGQGSALDPAANTDVAARKFADMTKRFQAQRGRAPTSAELYLMHQQGEGGAAAHWGAPDKPAWQNMLSTAEGRQKGADWARRAIWGNIPDDAKARFGSVDNVTSGDFSKLWADKVARHEQRFAGGASPQITAQAMLPTSTTPSQASQPRSRGMIDVLKGLFGGQAQAAEQPAPTADSIIASLDRLGIAKDDPMRGTYEYLAQSLTGGRKAKPEMSPMMQGLGVFADTLGAGFGRRGGNTAAAPMFMDRLKMQKAERDKADDRSYQAPLKMLEAVLPYRMKEIERQRMEKLTQGILGNGPAPIAPGGAGGVQIPGTAPLAPVERAELPAPGAPSPAGGPPAAGSPPQPQMAPGMPPAPGGPPAPQQQGLPQVPGGAPTGPAGPGSKFRITPEEIERRFPIPHSPQKITAMSVVNDKIADNMRQQNELVLKQREQFLKLYEVGRSTDDPESTKAKETAKLDAKREGDLATLRVEGARAAEGISNNLAALSKFIDSGDLSDSAIGPWDSSDEAIVGGPLGYVAPSGKSVGKALSAFDPREYGYKMGFEEMRAQIQQRGTAITAITKSLVRKPGEGTFSEGDQRQLEDLVGQLTQARDKPALKRKLAELSKVIEDSFAKPLGIRMPEGGRDPDKPQQAAPAAGQVTPEQVSAIQSRYQSADEAGKKAIVESLQRRGLDPQAVLSGKASAAEPGLPQRAEQSYNTLMDGLRR